MRDGLSIAIHGLSGAIGVAAFIYPFFLPSLGQGPLGSGRAGDAALVTALLVGLSLLALLVETQGRGMGAKIVAALGVLVAITSVLRFVALTIPGLGGISPVFAPILLGGYVFGARFGFLLGSYGLLVSALITGGVGPWLPYQMFAAGWAGLSAGWLAAMFRRSPGEGCSGETSASAVEHSSSWPSPRGRRSSGAGRRREVLALAAFGFAWGLIFGVVMNLYFWPFAMGPADRSWEPGTGVLDALARYAVFYVATSLWWDLARAVGNVALILLLGAPMLRALDRFRRRFHFELEAAR